MKTSTSFDMVLVNPPSSQEQEVGLLTTGTLYRPPLNLLNLGASLLQAGYTVKIVDGPTIPGGLDGTLQEILQANPRYVGLTGMTPHIHTCGQVADRLKAVKPDLPIIIGGVHVSTLPEETMRMFPAFDLGVLGEGDQTLVELLQKLDGQGDLSTTPGLVIRRGDELERTSPRPLITDLDALPLPAWELLPDYVKTYQPAVSRRTRLPSAYLVTSRGCPFPCTFCSHVVHGRRFRSYSVKRIMEMVDHLVRLYQIKDLTIYDENLAFDRQRIEDFCHRLIESHYDLTWSCDARADCVDEELLRLMQRAGCRGIWYGVESGNQEILSSYKKRLSLDQIEKAIYLTRKNKIKACGSFIIGGPQETVRTIRDTIRFAARIKLDYFVPFYYTVLPGTADYATIAQYGQVDFDFRSATATRPNFAPHGLKFEDIHYWYIRSMISFYARPSIFFPRLKEMGFQETIMAGLGFLVRGTMLFLRQLVALRGRKPGGRDGTS